MVNDGDYCYNNCSGYCCTKYTVIITCRDIIRILKNTPLKPLDFLMLFNANEETSKYFPKIIINSEEVVIGLKQKQNNACIFFLDEIGMCGIHLYKPMVCHTYPFTLDSDDKIVRLENICPGDWVPTDINGVKRYIHQAWIEMDDNKKKVEYWNQNKSNCSFQEFMKFLLGNESNNIEINK